MPEISKREKQIEWACRILLSVNVFVIVAGYIAYFQTKYQLLSPLIPRSILYEITDAYMKASLVSGCMFLIGIWLYSFKRRIASIIIFSLSALSYELLLTIFRK